MEMSKSQAETIEEKQNINKLSRKYTRRTSKQNQNGGYVDRNSDGAKVANAGTVAKGTHTRAEKTSCPAYGKSCRGCGKQNHYEAVCRSKKPNRKQEFKTQKPRHNVQNLVDENSSSEDSDEDGYAFSVNSTGKEHSQPMFNIVIHDTPMTIMADSGASVNVLDEKDYQALSKRPKLQTTKVKIHPYKSNKSLKVLGKFKTVLKFNTKCVEDKLYVVQGSSGSLLSWKTSQELGLLKAVHNVNDDSSPTTEKLIKEYDELVHGLGKLKGYQIKLHIDESVPPVAQPHRRVPFHVRQQLEAWAYGKEKIRGGGKKFARLFRIVPDQSRKNCLWN